GQDGEVGVVRGGRPGREVTVVVDHRVAARRQRVLVGHAVGLVDDQARRALAAVAADGRGRALEVRGAGELVVGQHEAVAGGRVAVPVAVGARDVDAGGPAVPGRNGAALG